MAVMASISVVQRVSRDRILCQMNVSKNPEWSADGHQRSLETKLQVDRRLAASRDIRIAAQCSQMDSFALLIIQSSHSMKSIVPPRRSPSNFGFEGPVTTVIWSIFNFGVS